MKKIIFNFLSIAIRAAIGNKNKIIFDLCLSKSAIFLFFIFFNFSLFTFHSFSQGVAINVLGNAPNPKAILDVSSTTSPYQGMLIPRLTAAERDLISLPIPESLLIFNTDTKCLEMYVNSAWNTVSCPATCAPPAQPAAITGNATVCESHSEVYSIIAVPLATSYSWSVPTGWSITDGQGTISLTVTTGSSSGNINVTANNSCGASVVRTLHITTDLAPVATAGGSQTICQTGTATVSGASSSNGTILWTENGVGSITSGATTLTPTYTPAAGDAGNTVTLTMTVTSNNSCTPATATATYTVNVSATPIASAGGSQTICQNGTATVSGASSSNGTILWTENGAGSITAGATTLTPTYTPAAGDAGNTVTLTMTVSNSPCTAATATYTVNVRATPTASAGGSQTICQNGTAIVSGANSTNGTILWTENGAGSITAGATTLTPTYTAAAGDAGNAVTLTMTVSNSPCAVATATYTVNVNALPTASAGGSQSICQTGTATVSGASSSNGTILWTENGAGSITSGATTLTPTYTAAAGDVGNTVTLTMTVTSNNACTPATATATYTVNVNAAPTASAGGSQTICQNETATVSGASSSNGTILWTENGAGSITAGATTLTPTYTAAAGDAGNTVTLTMTVSNSPCTAATATYTVNVNALPTASAGGSQSICQTGTATVSGASSTNGTIAWTENGAGSITAGATTLTPTYTAAGGDIGNTVTLTMTVSNNPCTAATATYTVNVNALPTASAGGSQTICQNGTATVSGASSSNGTILWTENGVGSITAGATTLTPTYTPAAGDVGNTVTLTMTVSNSPCTPATATYSVTVNPIPAQPSAITGVTTVDACVLTSQTYSVTNVPGTTYTWSVPSGWAITAGQGTSSITVTTGAAGTISVTGSVGSCTSTPRTLTVTDPTHGIGIPYQGGVIAYIFVAGDLGYVPGECHGLIAATSDAPGHFNWRCQASCAQTGAIYDEIGKGQINTTLIVGTYGSGMCTDYAAYWCDNYVSGGYSDWFLPSKDELYKLYINRDAIGGFETGAGNPNDPASYWSSSHDYNIDPYGMCGSYPNICNCEAQLLVFKTGLQGFNVTWEGSHGEWGSGDCPCAYSHVRAVRYF